MQFTGQKGQKSAAKKGGREARGYVAGVSGNCHARFTCRDLPALTAVKLPEVSRKGTKGAKNNADRGRRLREVFEAFIAAIAARRFRDIGDGPGPP